MTNWSPVLSKADFVRRYQEGEFGNAAPTWNTIVEFINSDNFRAREGLYHIRNRVRGGATFYNVACEDVPTTWERVCYTYGLDPSELYISAMAPTEKTLIQGEAFRGPKGLELFYSNLRKPMREALVEHGERADSLTARHLLEFYLDANSLEWLQVLYDRYPGHVIEFSTYSKKWGTLPGYNTVFWEVRKY